MFWSTPKSRRKFAQPVRRSVFLQVEALEDRTVPSGSTLLSTDPNPFALPHAALVGPANAGTPAPSIISSSAISSASVSQTASSALVTLHLNPIDLKLLGLEVKTSPITITISTQPGQGQLLGNLLNTVNSLVDLNQASQSLNTVLASTVNLLNSSTLSVIGAAPALYRPPPRQRRPC